MNSIRWFGMTVLAIAAAAVAGCGGGGTTKDAEYEIKGKVVAVADDKTSVTLDHEDIPGLMKAMKGMKYQVESPKVLEGISTGDQVKGRLTVKAGEQVITKLEKSSGTAAKESKEEAEIKANLAKLAVEDRQVAEAQKLCPITEERLGDPSMGTPFKVTVKDRTVFLCCKSCEKKALADPDKTLAKVNELKAKAAAPEK
jgi:Cu/Ag efflux protein CusF